MYLIAVRFTSGDSRRCFGDWGLGEVELLRHRGDHISNTQKPNEKEPKGNREWAHADALKNCQKLRGRSKYRRRAGRARLAE